MRVARVAAGAALLLIGVVVAALALGVPGSTLRSALSWSPALLCVAGLWILYNYVRPRSVVLIALILMVAGGLVLVGIRQLAGPTFWVICIAIALVTVGLRLILVASRGQGELVSTLAAGDTFVVRRFRPGTVVAPREANAVAIAVGFVNVELELPHADDVSLEVDATVVLGSLRVLVPKTLPPERCTVRHAFSVTGSGVRIDSFDAPEEADPDILSPAKLSIVVVGLVPKVRVEHALEPSAVVAS
jgi:hypothetical protein